MAEVRGRRRSRSAALATTAVLGLVSSACVDHGANALRFCDGVADVVRTELDDEVLTGELAGQRADAVAQVMRYAEDGTRPVREAGRAVLAAYDDHVATIEDPDSTQAEAAEDVRAIREARSELRSACSETEASDG